jgi:hypothetical protein
MSDYTGAATTVPAAVGNSQIADYTPAQATAAFSGVGTIKTPTKNFTVMHQGRHVEGRKGIPLVCDAGLLATLTAQSAPVV